MEASADSYIRLKTGAFIVKADGANRLVDEQRVFGLNNRALQILKSYNERVAEIIGSMMVVSREPFHTNWKKFSNFLEALKKFGLAEFYEKPCQASVENGKVMDNTATFCPYYKKCQGCEPESFSQPMIFPYPGCAGIERSLVPRILVG